MKGKKLPIWAGCIIAVAAVSIGSQIGKIFRKEVLGKEDRFVAPADSRQYAPRISAAAESAPAVNPTDALKSALESANAAAQKAREAQPAK